MSLFSAIRWSAASLGFTKGGDLFTPRGYEHPSAASDFARMGGLWPYRATNVSW